jgi:hypothetical protein
MSSPFVDRDAPASTCRLTFGAHAGKRDWRYGQISMGVKRVKRVAFPKGVVKKAATPAERQIYRELQPVVADMLRNLEVAVRLEVPKRFTAGHLRNARAGARTATLFALSGKDLDAGGKGFLDNEEIMAAMLQMDLEADVIQRHACAFPNNDKTPVLRGKRLRHSAGFRTLPTKHMIDRYFGGKKPSR